MKQRIISALCGLVILSFVILNFSTVILNFAVSLVVVIALAELIVATGYKKNILLTMVTLLFGALLPFYRVGAIHKVLPAALFIYAFTLFCLLLSYHNEVSVEHVGFIFTFSVFISISLACLVYLRDTYGNSVGLYAILVILVGAWASDSGAYFVGVFFGKNKLAPSISPKKTIEGAFGGALCALFVQVLVGQWYLMLLEQFNVHAQINFTVLIFLSPVISGLSIIGDLVASLIKRHFGVKDFGHIMPGHGGVLDRFDSVLMVIPFVYILFSIYPIIKII